jgi:hypothetical protein
MSRADAKYTITNHTERALARLPGRHADSTNLRKWIAIYTDEMQMMEDVTSKITASILFDVDTAIGINQDQIGSMLGHPREGRTDTAYRIILQCVAKLVLGRRQTQHGMIKIVRCLMDTDPGDITYTQESPKSFKLEILSASLATLMSWVPVLRRCRPATYIALLAWSTPGHLSYGNGDTTEPGVDPAVTGYGNGDTTEPGVDPAVGGYSALILF